MKNAVVLALLCGCLLSQGVEGLLSEGKQAHTHIHWLRCAHRGTVPSALSYPAWPRQLGYFHLEALIVFQAISHQTPLQAYESCSDALRNCSHTCYVLDSTFLALIA